MATGTGKATRLRAGVPGALRASLFAPVLKAVTALGCSQQAQSSVIGSISIADMDSDQMAIWFGMRRAAALRVRRPSA